MTPAQAKRAKFLVLVTVFFDMIGVGIAFPTCPILVGKLTSSPAEQATWYGILMAAYALMQFVCAPLMGALADKFGRRKLLLITIVGLSLHYLILALAPSVWVILFARLLGGITGASFSVASAYLADISAPEDRAKSFGLIGAAFGLGFIFGPLIGGVLGKFDPHLPFYVGSACSALNFIYAYLFVKESLPPERRTPFQFSKANPFGALYQLLATVGVLSAVVQGGLVGILVKRFGEARLAVLSLCTATVCNALYGFATEGWMMYAILVAGSIGFTGGPAIQGIISKTTDPNVQGVTMGALQSITSLSGVFAPMLAATILSRVLQYPPQDYRVGAVFYLCSALDFVALLLIWSHIRGLKPLQPAPTLGDFR